MKSRRLAAKYMDREDDWRASYHLSAAAALPEKGEYWPALGALAQKCMDGWKVSRNPLSLAYDERINTAPAYRLRHVAPMELRTDSLLWQPPEISQQPFCVQPFDILVRKVGEVHACLILPNHNQHPADSNLSIIRGLQSELAVWVCWCINQPLYRAYLENTADTLTPLVRLGLKRLREMPIAELPETFKVLARQFITHSQQLAEAQNILAALGREVQHFVQNWEPVTKTTTSIKTSAKTWRARWFKAMDLDTTLLMPHAEQRSLSRLCIEAYGALPITDLARINPLRKPVLQQQEFALRIKDLGENLDINPALIHRNEVAWRFRSSPVQQYDVLVSTLASDSRVALMSHQPAANIYPSEQIVTFAFHKHQAAWAMVMETAFVQKQLASLATGTAQLFIPPHLLDRLVLPPLEEFQAKRWHRQTIRALKKAADARQQLNDLYPLMQQHFIQVHGEAGIKTTNKGIPQ